MDEYRACKGNIELAWENAKRDSGWSRAVGTPWEDNVRIFAEKLSDIYVGNLFVSDGRGQIPAFASSETIKDYDIGVECRDPYMAGIPRQGGSKTKLESFLDSVEIILPGNGDEYKFFWSGWLETNGWRYRW